MAEITLPTTGWPDFQDGRVLTHNDLNRLRDYLYTKYAFQNNALFGFGVACGLGGSVDGTKLTVSPGFALAGGGRELMLDAPFEYDLTDLAGESLEEFDFVDGKEDGYTAVLCPDDTPRAAGGVCDPDDCTLHTDIVDEGVRVSFARGRLKSEGVFSSGVFALNPIAVNTPGPIAGFPQLQEKLKGFLEPHLGAPTIKLLTDLELKGTAGVDLMKVGILNEVLYAAWDFFRCRAYGSLSCFGEEYPECVALGWVSENGAWAWHCRHRHHFVLSRALYSAIRGARCEDLCQVHLDHIRAILETFEPPPTKEDDPPKDWPDPDVHVCDLRHLYKGKCIWWKKPELIYEVELPPLGGKGSPLDPIWNPPEFTDLYVDEELIFINPLLDPVRPEDVVVNVKLDPYGAGVLPTNQFLGFDGDQVAGKITSTLEDRGVAPTVEVVSMADFESTSNLRPGLALAATDAIYLGTNSKGTVIVVGAVPTTTALGDVPGIRVDAQNALGMAEQLEADFGAIEQNFVKLGDDFVGIQEDFGNLDKAFQGLKPETLTQLPVVIDQQFATLEARLPSEDVLGKVGGYVAQFEKLQAAVEGFGDKIDGLERSLGEKGVELAGTKEQLEATQFEVKQVSGQLERTAQMQTRRVDDTVGEFLNKALEGGFGGRLGEDVLTRAPLVRSLESLTAAVEAAAPVRAREEVRTALEAGRPALDALRGAAPEAELEANAASAALESILAALRATGLSTDRAEYRRARREVSELQKLLGGPEG
jgi:hypothetical protein